MTSGLSWRLGPRGQDTAAVAGLTFCSLVLLAQARAGGQGRRPGASRQGPSQVLPGPRSPGRRGDPGPGRSPPGPALSGWAASGRAEAPEMGHGPARGFCLGTEPELPLFLYNKPVAWWGNLRVSQMTAAGPGQRCPQCEGAASPRGSGPGRAVGWPGTVGGSVRPRGAGPGGRIRACELPSWAAPPVSPSLHQCPLRVTAGLRLTLSVCAPAGCAAAT